VSVLPPCMCRGRRHGEDHQADCPWALPLKPVPPIAVDSDVVETSRRQTVDALKAVESANVASAVDHPAHYGGADNPYEAIKVIENWLTLEQFHGFCIGNVVKYLSRAGRKEGEPTEKDLRKAAWYLDRAIEKRLKQ